MTRWTEGVVREVLPNGLTLLVQPDRSAPVAAVVTHVKAGFFDEPDRWIGVSHVLEHMFFKGTPTRGVGEIARQTKAAGGYLNAGTSYDYTVYYVVLPAGGLAQAIDIQADALRRSLIDPDELGRELQVIIQEAKRKLDTPEGLVHETLHEVLFDRHRMRRWRIGTESQLAGYTRADVWGYYQSRYVPERTIVTIVGDVDPHEALALARQAYGDWPGRAGAVDPSPEEPARRDLRSRTLRTDVTQAHLALGWRTVGPLHPDAQPLDLAAAVLALGRGSWCYGALRESGVVSSVGAYSFAPTELGVFSVHAELAPERIPEALDVVGGLVRRLAEAPPPEEDLERARTLLLARWSRALEGTDGRASALAAAEALGGVHLLDEEFARLATLTGDEVSAAVARHLVADSAAAVVLLPREGGEELTPERLGRALATAAAPLPAARPASPPPPPAAAGAVRRGRLEAGTVHRELGGVDLLVRRKTGTPLVSLGGYLRREGDPPDQAGISALAMRGALRGIADVSAGALARALERLGGSLSPSVTSDWCGLGTSVLVDRLDEAARWLRAALRQPALRDADLVRERDLLLAEAARVTDDNFRYPFQLAFSAAYGSTGYGLPLLGLPETLAQIEPAAVRRWFGEQVLPRRLTVVAVGDVDPEDAADRLSAVFDRWPANAPDAVGPPQPWARGGVRERVVLRDKAQTAFALLFPGPTRRQPDRVAAEVWAAVASGLGGRLFEALRDRRSLAYTVLATSWQRAGGGALAGYIATSPEREDEARGAMLAELARFVAQPVEPDELDRARAYLAGQAEVRRQHAAGVMGELLEAWYSGAGLVELADPAGPYRGVTAEAVQAVAAANLNPASRVEGVVRGSGGGR